MKLKKIAKVESGQDFAIHGGYFFDFVPRIVDMSFPLREETEEDLAQNSYQNRLAVDIFILDELPAIINITDTIVI